MIDRLILASASPRRRELLARAGILFTVESADLDETPLPEEPAAAYVERLAIEKAQAVAARHAPVNAPVTILAADTAVVLPGGTVLGKPVDADDARRMLVQLSGRTHAVLTGGAVLRHVPKLPPLLLSAVEVDPIAPDEVARYVASGEPLDKAGAYAIQGLAARWIPRIEGDYTNVVGLPIARTIQLLAGAGFRER